jgi:hypothetical protein
MKLPKPNLMDSVGTAVPIKRRNFLVRLHCSHRETTKFTWIDHRAGPGSFADTWLGLVCVYCGQVLDKFPPAYGDERTKLGAPWPLTYSKE